MEVLRLLQSITYPDARSQWRVSRVYWLVLLLIVVWVFLQRIGPNPAAEGVREGPFFAVLFAAILNLSVRSWASVQRRKGGLRTPFYGKLGWLFVTVDLALIALGLRFTGGIHSPLWIVMFVVVTAETILASPKETSLIRMGAALALIGGTLPFPQGGQSWKSEEYRVSLITTGYLLELLTRLSFLTAVNSVVRRLRENSAATDRENAVLRAEVALADERSKLSREVHDGVGNSLAASVLRLEVAARTLEKRAAPDSANCGNEAALLRDEAKSLREAMTAIRDWTFFTRPWPASEINASDGGDGIRLPSAAPAVSASHVLAAEVDRLSRRTGLPITISGTEMMDTLPAPQRLAALRITQEALTNTAKYAKDATGATVSLHRDEATRMVILTITDDGCGFDDGKAGAGLGLSSMRERAEGLGGRLSIDSTAGGGTRVVASLPLA
ncbi:MAG: ATP-binding protein [Armatimonadota bacterium]